MQGLLIGRSPQLTYLSFHLWISDTCYENGDYYLGQLDLHAQILTDNECQHLCQTNPECYYWSHTTRRPKEKSFCRLFTEDAIKAPTQCEAQWSCIRGPKICQGKTIIYQVNSKIKSWIRNFH